MIDRATDGYTAERQTLSEWYLSVPHTHAKIGWNAVIWSRKRCCQKGRRKEDRPQDSGDLATVSADIIQK